MRARLRSEPIEGADVSESGEHGGDGPAGPRPDSDDGRQHGAGRRERRRRLRQRRFDDSIPSPCIQVCQLDEDDLCLGCRRHVDEIRDWPIMTAEEKRTALERVAARKTADPGPAGGDR